MKQGSLLRSGGNNGDLNLYHKLHKNQPLWTESP
jgi:hypothetical protein